MDERRGAAVGRDARGQRGLTREYVVSESIYQQETERIFQREWLCVGRASEFLTGTGVRPLVWEGQHLLAVRGDDGQLRVFRNFCRHRGSVLVTNENCDRVGQRLQCPYHAWTYDRQGGLRAAPNMDGVAGFDAAEHGLMAVPSQVVGGFLWLNFGPLQSAEDYLQSLATYWPAWGLEDLAVAAEIRYEVQANWKLIFQNYNECYHCPVVHPALNRLTPYQGSSNACESGPILGGPMQLAADCQTMSESGRSVAPCLPGLSSAQRGQVFYFTIFPSMFLSLHPDYVLTHRLQRVGPSRTEVVCQFLCQGEAMAAAGFDLGPAVRFWDLTNRQDWEVCQWTQTGMQDPAYVPGPYSNLESIVAAFDRYYLATLAAD